MKSHAISSGVDNEDEMAVGIRVAGEEVSAGAEGGSVVGEVGNVVVEGGDSVVEGGNVVVEGGSIAGDVSPEGRG